MIITDKMITAAYEAVHGNPVVSRTMMKLCLEAVAPMLLADADQRHAKASKIIEEALQREFAALAKVDVLELTGKHLAVKLAEMYRAAGVNPAKCQAIQDWMKLMEVKK